MNKPQTPKTLQTLKINNSPWKNPQFRYFAIANFINNIGGNLYAFAIPLYSLQIENSLAWLNVLIAVFPLISLCTGPIFGYFVDKYSFKVAIYTGLCLQISISIAMNVLIHFGKMNFFLLTIIELVVQSGSSLYRIGWMASFPTTFPQYPGKARGILAMLFDISGLIGPLITTFFIAYIGFEGFFLINTATFFAPLIVSYLHKNLFQNSAPPHSTSMKDSIISGFRYFSNDKTLRTFIIFLIFPLCFISTSSITGLVIYELHSKYASTSENIAIIMFISNLTTICISFLVVHYSKLSSYNGIIMFMVGLLFALLAMARSHSVIVTAIAYTFFCLCITPLDIIPDMILFNKAPKEKMGSILGAYRIIGNTPAFFSPLLIAGLSHYLNVHQILFIICIIFIFPSLGFIYAKNRIHS